MKPTDAISRQSDYTSDGFTGRPVPKKPAQSQQDTLKQSDLSGEWSHPPSAGRSAEPGRTLPPSVDSIRKLYLRSALTHTLAKVDGKPVTKKEWADYERLRQLVRMLRQAGKLGWGEIRLRNALRYVFAGCVLVVGFALFVKPDEQFRVLQQFNDTDFQLQRVVFGHPQQPEVHRFCEKVPLEVGFTLTKLQVQDRGDCWTTAPFQLPYIIERIPGSVMPTLPANCHQDPQDPIYGRVSCSGSPKFD